MRQAMVYDQAEIINLIGRGFMREQPGTKATTVEFNVTHASGDEPASLICRVYYEPKPVDVGTALSQEQAKDKAAIEP